MELSEVLCILCILSIHFAFAEEGQLYIWGYSKACGRRRHDVRLPEHIDIKGKEIRQAAGGSSHSLALTGEMREKRTRERTEICLY